MTTLPSVGPPQLATVSPRLDALAELVKIGRARDGFSASLLDDSEDVLRRAGERLRLSASHTVVALAGGTGSGKSTLFNALAGATFSPSGVTRPITRQVHACVWGMQGAGPLLDWLGVQRRHRYARASALDSGEATLNGLLLLDLPDHDSVIAESTAAVDRVSRLADMLVWVLDPQKYADASVHNRYLIPLARHASVFVVVLNQAELLDDQQRADCEEDLRRLLDAEGLTDAALLTVSARTGEGLDGLRALLAREIAASHAAGTRIAADIDVLAGEFAAYAAGPAGSADTAAASVVPAPVPAGPGADPAPKAASKPPWEISGDELGELAGGQHRPPWEDAAPADARAERDTAALAANVPEGPAAELVTAFGDAAGISAVAEGLAAARAEQVARYADWPAARLRGRPGGRRRGADGGRAIPGEAQQADVDNAITAFADALSGALPAPWPQAVRAAARARAAEIPAALGAVAAAPPTGRASAWWRLVALWQWLLIALAAAAAIVAGAVHAWGVKSALPADMAVIPWLAAIAVAALLLGWLTAFACRRITTAAAGSERVRIESAMRERVAAAARDLVLAPVGAEIGEYERFRGELAVAACG